MTLSYILVTVHGFCNEVYGLLLAFSCNLAIAKSSLDELPMHPGVGGLYRGPNSETIIKGPDGSVITVEAQGGSVHTQPNSEQIVVETVVPVTQLASEVSVSAEATSTVATSSAVDLSGVAIPIAAVPVAPASILAHPTVSINHNVEIVEPDPHIIETEIVDAPLVEPQEFFDLVGPSGSISTRGSSSVISGPASTTILEPAKVLLATPLIAAVPVVSSITTPLQAAPVVEIVPDIPTPTSSISPQPTTLNSPVTEVSVSPEVVSTESSLSLLEPHSSYGIIDSGSSSQVSSTTRPEVDIVSAVASSVVPQQEILTSQILQTRQIASVNLETDLDQALINSRQLNINPSLIPAANIIPPEIGPLPAGAFDLGTTVTVSSPPTIPELSSSLQLPNIQRNDKEARAATVSNGRSIDQKLSEDQHISNKNHIAVSSSHRTGSSTINSLLVLPTSIPQNGIIGSELVKYGIDSSQINLASVPLSSATIISPKRPLPISVSDNEDASSTLWNRYGRNVDNENNKNDGDVKN